MRDLTFQVSSSSVIPEDDGDENTPDNELFEDVAPPSTLNYASLVGGGGPGGSVLVPPGGTATVSVPAGVLGSSPGALGWMIVTHDDPNGAPQADLDSQVGTRLRDSMERPRQPPGPLLPLLPDPTDSAPIPDVGYCGDTTESLQVSLSA